MTTLPIVLLLATAVFGYGDVDMKAISTQNNENELENSVNTDDQQELKNEYDGNFEPTVQPDSDPSESGPKLATGCFGHLPLDNTATSSMETNSIPLPYNPPMPVSNNIENYQPIPTTPPFTHQFPPYPPRPLIDPIPPQYQNNQNYGAVPPFMYNRYQRQYRPFLPPFQRISGGSFNRPMPPPLVIVKLLQPIILPVAKSFPEERTEFPDVETNDLLTHERYETPRRFNRNFEGRKMFNSPRPFERLRSVKSNHDDTMHISIKVY